MPDFKAEIRQSIAELDLPPEREAEIVDEISQHLQTNNRLSEISHYSSSLNTMHKLLAISILHVNFKTWYELCCVLCVSYEGERSSQRHDPEC